MLAAAPSAEILKEVAAIKGDDTVLGQAFPDFEASAHGQLSAGPFDLSFLVRGQFGNQMFNNTALVYSTKGNVLQSKNFLRSALTDLLSRIIRAQRQRIEEQPAWHAGFELPQRLDIREVVLKTQIQQAALQFKTASVTLVVDVHAHPGEFVVRPERLRADPDRSVAVAYIQCADRLRSITASWARWLRRSTTPPTRTPWWC